MAVIVAQLSKALDLLETAISSALVPTVVVRSPSEIILSFDHGFVDEIYGTGFFWDDETGVTTGTIDRIVERREGELTFTISDISVPLVSLLTWFEQGDWQAFNQYILNRADLVIGSDSGDRLYTFAGNDIVVANGGDDEIDAGSGNDYIDAGSGNDSVYAGDGNDSLDGGVGGADELFGGNGNDTVSHASSGQGVIVDLQAQSTWDGVVSDRLDSIENAIGSRFDDQLWGNNGNNVLDGGAGGSDDLFGRGGNDTASYASSGQGVIVDLQAQSTWDGVASDRLDSIENAIGSRFDDQIWGNEGDNVLDGGPGGSDDLFGRGGNDTASYASSGQGVIVDLHAQSTWDGVASDRLDSIENAIGSRFDDQIWGNEGDNVLDGGAGGSDDLFGRGGNDTASYTSSGQGVIVDLQAQSTWDGVASDRLEGIENAIGSRFDDQIWGNEGDNVLDGGAGGSDDLFGGAGNDTANYGSSDRGVAINLDSQRTWDGLYTDRLQGIENATGSAFADVIYGSSQSNKFTGGAGADLFVLGSSWGHDEISDFTQGEDKIQISVEIFTDFDDVMNSIYSANDYTIIQADPNNTLTFGIAAHLLSSSDFLFV